MESGLFYDEKELHQVLMKFAKLAPTTRKPNI